MVLIVRPPHGVHWPRTVRSAPRTHHFKEGNVVSQNVNPGQTPEDGSLESAVPSPSPDAIDAASSNPEVVASPEEESTVGTGTSMALGCIAGTVVLIIFGLLFLALSRLV